jgi:hypothetical protein
VCYAKRTHENDLKKIAEERVEMATVVIIKPNGDVKTGKFSKAKHVTLQHTWTTPTYDIQLYAKLNGAAGTENKYDLPPPMDTPLFFGDIVIASSTGNFTEEMWNTYYESIMQFEDIEDTEDEEEEIPEGECTKEGYLKDGFVVSDSELEEEEYKIDIKS